MSDTPIYARGVIHHPYSAIRFHDPVINLVEGVVHSQHLGLVHTLVRIRVGRQVELHMKLPMDDERCFVEGRTIIVMIPAEAVRLEAGLFRRSRQRLNRWYGRIVLVQQHREGHVVTAKVHGERWSLKSTLPILGSSHPIRTWNSVSIVVDPQAIKLIPGRNVAPQEPKSLFRRAQRLEHHSHPGDRPAIAAAAVKL